MIRTCAAPSCNKTFTAVTGPAGGGGANQVYCGQLCLQRAYRRRKRDRRPYHTEVTGSVTRAEFEVKE